MTTRDNQQRAGERDRWMQSHEAELFDLAHAGYAAVGRGVLVIEDDGRFAKSMDAVAPAFLDRVAALRVDADQRDGPDPELARLIDVYDPLTSMVLVFSYPDGAYTYLRVGTK